LTYMVLLKRGDFLDKKLYINNRDAMMTFASKGHYIPEDALNYSEYIIDLMHIYQFKGLCVLEEIMDNLRNSPDITDIFKLEKITDDIAKKISFIPPSFQIFINITNNLLKAADENLNFKINDEWYIEYAAAFLTISKGFDITLTQYEDYNFTYTPKNYDSDMVKIINSLFINPSDTVERWLKSRIEQNNKQKHDPPD